MSIKEKLIQLKNIFLIFIFLVQIKSEEISISLNDISADTTTDNYKIKSNVLTLQKSGNYKI